jgi:hypothetical protein
MPLPDRVRLPISFDPVPLAGDIERLSKDAWYLHFIPQNFEGDWSVIPLRSAVGETHPVRMIYSDPGASDFADTPFLQQCPGLRTVLEAFDCELRSVRLMRLARGSSIKEHRDHDLVADLGMARLHIPLVTNPEVVFRLNGSRIAMKPGEVWYLRLSDLHSVTNLGQTDRIHLVIDAIVNDWLRDAIVRGATPSQAGPESAAPIGLPVP